MSDRLSESKGKNFKTIHEPDRDFFTSSGEAHRSVRKVNCRTEFEEGRE